MDEVVELYGDKVSLVFKHFPLEMHPEAHLASQAAECARDQGKFWEYHDVLFANQSDFKPETLPRYAAQLSLDIEIFQACLDSKKYAARVDSDLAQGALVGMSGTPGFYINGIPLAGAQPLPAFQQIIDGELARIESVR